MDGNIAAGAIYDMNLVISDSSHFVYSDDGVLYNRDMTKLYACPTRAEGTVTIPASVTNICADAFFGCFRLAYLNIPAAVSTIGSGAFNVAGIWPGLPAPESSPKLQSVFFNGEVPDAAADIYNGAPAGLTNYVFTGGWDNPWKDRPVVVIDSAKPPVLSIKDGDGITWYYRIVNGSVEIYNEDSGGNAIAAISPKNTSGVPYREDKDSTTYRTALKVPNSINGYAVTRIGDHAFDGCKALTYIGIPASVEEIGDSAFKDCTAVRAIDYLSDAFPFSTTDGQIVLPAGVMKLGYHPFEGMKASYVSIPYTLTETEGNPFAGMEFVREVEVDAANTMFYASGNIVYDRRRAKVIGVPANYDGASISFPATVKEIGFESLRGCKNLDTVTLPASLETISSNAFAGCSGLAALTIPAMVAEIGTAAFTNCASLAKVTYEGNAPTTPDNLYAGTPESLTSWVNEDAAGFASGTWRGRPVVVVSSSDGDGADELSATIGGITWYFRVVDDMAEIWRRDLQTAVASDEPIMTLNLPGTLGGYVVKGIGAGALSDLRGVTRISLPDTYEWIGDYAFSNCTSLASVSLGNGVERIGKWPFCGTKLTTMTIPDSVTEIDGNLVAGCSMMQSISVADTQPYFSIDDGLLYDKDSATLISCPATKTQVEIPESVTSIADDAFAGCAHLARTTFYGNAPSTSEDIFADTSATMTSYIYPYATGFTSGTWKNRPIRINDTVARDQTYNDGTVQWTYDRVGGKAIITGAEGDVTGKIVTIPGALDGFATSELTSDALDSLTGVKGYESSSDLFVAKNGCLYSADGKTLIRVPNGLVLPYSVTTVKSSDRVTVTTIPRLLESGNPGNDGTSITTNRVRVSSSTTTTDVAGDISFETILSGVTAIADHAFYGCNASLIDEQEDSSQYLDGETGFIGANGDPYVKMTTSESSTVTTYKTIVALPASVTSVAEGAFEDSTVEADRTQPGSRSATQTKAETHETPELEANTSYIGWIENNGHATGTISIKTGKKTGGALKLTGSAVKIGSKKITIKSEAALSALGDIVLVKDISKSKTEKKAFNTFKGKCWTIAYETVDAPAGIGGYATLSVSVSQYGKVRIKGFAPDGTKFSGSAQMVRDGAQYRIPLAVQTHTGKKGGIALCLAVNADGSISADSSAEFAVVHDRAIVALKLALIDASALGSAPGSYLLVSDDALNAGFELDSTLKGWKPRYTKSTGEIKGSVSFIRSSDSRRVKATVNGIAVGGIGYCSATVKKAGVWPALIVPPVK